MKVEKIFFYLSTNKRKSKIKKTAAYFHLSTHNQKRKLKRTRPFFYLLMYNLSILDKKNDLFTVERTLITFSSTLDL